MSTQETPQGLKDVLLSPEIHRVVRHVLVALAGILGVSAITDPTFSPVVDSFVATVIALVTYGWSRASDGKSPIPGGVTKVLPLLAIAIVMAGCQSVGAKVDTNRQGAKIEGVTPPVVVDIQDDERRGTLIGTGPGGMLDTGDTKAFFANSPPQAISFSDGRRTVSLTGAANLSGKRLKFNADDSVEIGEFSTLQSETIKASNEGVIGTSAERIALTQAQRDALIAQVQASETIASEMKPALIALIEGLFTTK